MKTSEARLDGRGPGALEPVVLRDKVELKAEDDEALEDGLPLTDLRPLDRVFRVLGGDREASLE